MYLHQTADDRIDPALAALRAKVAAGPPYSAEFLAALESDLRPAARFFLSICLHYADRAGEELDRVDAMFEFERLMQAQGFRCVAGVDEAGRGPLAGPIVAGAVILAGPVPGLDDSKRLTAEKREALFDELEHGGHAVAYCVIDADFIDQRGIQCANYAAMAGAASKLTPLPDFLLVDGFRIRGCPFPQESLVKGDQRSQSIAAASVVAKVVRDRMMLEFDRAYPDYGFARHKGYATEDHLASIERLGPCPIHRRSFSPFVRVAETGLLFEN